MVRSYSSPRDLFVARTGQANNMIVRDRALLRIEFRQVGRFRDVAVENNNGQRRERFLSLRARARR